MVLGFFLFFLLFFCPTSHVPSHPITLALTLHLRYALMFTFYTQTQSENLPLSKFNVHPRITHFCLSLFSVQHSFLKLCTHSSPCFMYPGMCRTSHKLAHLLTGAALLYTTAHVFPWAPSVLRGTATTAEWLDDCIHTFHVTDMGGVFPSYMKAYSRVSCLDTFTSICYCVML